MLCCLASQEGCPDHRASLCDRSDDCRVPFGLERSHGHVIDEGERSGANCRQVIDAHGYEVMAHATETSGRGSYRQLRPDAIGRHHQDGSPVALRNLDPRCKPAESTDHLVSPCGCD